MDKFTLTHAVPYLYKNRVLYISVKEDTGRKALGAPPHIYGTTARTEAHGQERGPLHVKSVKTCTAAAHSPYTCLYTYSSRLYGADFGKAAGDGVEGVPIPPFSSAPLRPVRGCFNASDGVREPRSSFVGEAVEGVPVPAT